MDSFMSVLQIVVCGRLKRKVQRPVEAPDEVSPQARRRGGPLPVLILGCISCGFSELSFAVVQLDIGPRSDFRCGCRLSRAAAIGSNVEAAPAATLGRAETGGGFPKKLSDTRLGISSASPVGRPRFAPINSLPPDAVSRRADRSVHTIRIRLGGP